jgi:DNA-directed RNA polymerase specialized sigma24 family protein
MQRQISNEHKMVVYRHVQSLIPMLTRRLGGDLSAAEDLAGDIIEDYLNRRIGVRDYEAWIEQEIKRRIGYRYDVRDAMRVYKHDTLAHDTGVVEPAEEVIFRIETINSVNNWLKNLPSMERDVFISHYIREEKKEDILARHHLSERKFYRVLDLIRLYLKERLNLELDGDARHLSFEDIVNNASESM